MSDWKEAIPNSTESETWDRTGTLQGVYTAKKTGVGQNESTVYTVQTKDKDFSVWGSAVLDSRFEQVPVGSEVKLQCLGKVKSEKTGREYYDYKLEYRPAPFVEAQNVSTPYATKDSLSPSSGKPSQPVNKPEEIVPEDLDDEVNLDDIPF